MLEIIPGNLVTNYRPKEGDVADRSSTLLISALTRAAAEADGAPLYSGKNSPGLFPTTSLGKQAAQRSCEEGYLAVRDQNGRFPICTITEKGLRYLLGQANPRQVLDDCVRILEAREAQLAQLLATARQTQAGLESLRTTIVGVLSRLETPSPDLKTQFAEFRQEPAPALVELDERILTALARRTGSAVTEDCPLPELFRHCGATSIGLFHDALRRLQAAEQLWLHPWTGPLYEMPEPSYALLVGHEIAYYASPRRIKEG